MIKGGGYGPYIKLYSEFSATYIVVPIGKIILAKNVDKKGYIVNGHHRYDAYEKLGATYVPVIKVNTTIEELIDKY